MIQQATDGRTLEQEAMDRLAEMVAEAKQARRYGNLTVTVEFVDGKIVVVRESTDFTHKK